MKLKRITGNHQSVEDKPENITLLYRTSWSNMQEYKIGIREPRNGTTNIAVSLKSE